MFINNTARIGDDVYNTVFCESSLVGIIKTNIKETTDPVAMCFCNHRTIPNVKCPQTIDEQIIFLGKQITLFVTLLGYGFNTTYIVTGGSITLHLNHDIVHVGSREIGPKECSININQDNYNTTIKKLKQTLMLKLNETSTFVSESTLAHGNAHQVSFSVLPCPIN